MNQSFHIIYPWRAKVRAHARTRVNFNIFRKNRHINHILYIIFLWKYWYLRVCARVHALVRAMDKWYEFFDPIISIQEVLSSENLKNPRSEDIRHFAPKFTKLSKISNSKLLWFSKSGAKCLMPSDPGFFRFSDKQWFVH